MKERPILFSAPMVRALLDGRKTQTRRVVKPQPEVSEKGNLMGEWLRRPLGGLLLPKLQDITMHCPYGVPGDRLWVRESFWGCDAPGYGDQPCVVYDDEHHRTHYRAAEVRPWARKFGRIPSIHMPRDCSRITLEITGARVERLQDISEQDAKSEGVTVEGDGDPIYPHTYAFAKLWEEINGKGTWLADPWVWVVEFRRVA